MELKSGKHLALKISAGSWLKAVEAKNGMGQRNDLVCFQGPARKKSFDDLRGLISK